MRLRLPPWLEAALGGAAAEWTTQEGTRRLWERDATLWTDTGEERWLGWLDAPRRAESELGLWDEIAADARGFEHALVLGMGGSSLAPEVQRAAFGRVEGFPRMHVLDSIHPAQIARVEASLDPGSTLVVVASKSGSTLEPNLLLARLLDTVGAAVGADEAPRRCVAITDPGSKLEALARERGFRRIVHGEPTIGGRFSAISPFGLVPAAIQGLPVAEWIGRARAAVEASHEEDPAQNRAVTLGLLLAAAARANRDKLTLVPHPTIDLLGVWLEQLVAESTGKRGRAILPFAGERLSDPGAYGNDRIFVALTLGGELAPGDAGRLDALARAGWPVVELDLADPLELSGEMTRWEIATAVAGARLGVNPFDQPDVESAKRAASRLAQEIERTGTLPTAAGFARGEGWSLAAPETQARVLRSGAGPEADLGSLLRAHVRRLVPGDYFALLCFCAAGPATEEAGARIRSAVRDASGCATSVGFGPRYLHSTGQAHKGGPDSGVFLFVTDEPEHDLPVPGQKTSFGQAIAAQARGDFEVLAERGRRVLEVHLEGPAEERLPALADVVERALDSTGH